LACRFRKALTRAPKSACSSPSDLSKPIGDARRQALCAARLLVQEELMHGTVPGEGWIDMEDEDHQPILSIPLRSAAC
jgi:uncharacterized protein DUF6894